MTAIRVETDSFGPLDVPADKYWGAQTQRSIINFPIGWERQPVAIIRALGVIKQACALVNIAQGDIDTALGQTIAAAAQEVIAAWFPRLNPLAMALTTSRLIPAAALFLAIFMLFLSLTPSAYRGKSYPKWPGALLVTVWWVGVTVSLPFALREFLTYDLTYGSLAGVMITLFFFWLVGLGMVVGAELNAALAETPEERDLLGQADDRARRQLERKQGENA